MNLLGLSVFALAVLAIACLLRIDRTQKDLMRMRRAVQSLCRREPVCPRLKFSNFLACDLWRAILNLSGQQLSSERLRPAFDEVISVSNLIASASYEVSSAADAIISVILKQSGPDVAAIGVALKNPTNGELRVEKVHGVPLGRVEQPLLSIFDQLLENSLKTSFDWGYQQSLKGCEFDFSTFGIGLFLTVPLRKPEGLCGGIWIGLRDGAGSLSPGKRAFVQAVCEHSAALFYAAQRSREKNEQHSKEKDFLIGMSHDLRAPGNSALYAVRDLLSGELGPLAPEQHLRLSVVEQCLEDQLDILSDVLNFAKHQKGALEAKPRPIRVRPLLSQVVNGFCLSAERNNLVLICEQLSDSIILADPHHLKRIVSNFLSNAIKYTDAGSVTISALEQHDECLIRVTDTGVGIPADKTDTLFEEFRRIEGTRNRPGVGLGLALTKALANLNGGRVWYEPNPEGGSVFLAAFKLLHSAERPALGLYIPRFNSVLVVDDDRAACRTNMRYLQGHADTLVPAQSFAQAYELALDLRPDLLITDYNLGDGDGVRLLERLANADVSIPTVLISGSNGIPGLDSIMKRFNVRILEKPVDRESLIHAAAAVYAS